MRLLVVDDSSTMRRIVRNSLKTAGHEDVIEAENGEVAYALLQRERVDAVITDWNMPVMNGLELVRKIRATPDLQQTPILMVTTVAEKEHILEAVQAGVTGYVVKPFDPPTLKQKVEHLFAR